VDRRGVFAAIVVPVAASLCLTLAQTVGLPVDDLRELPPMMIMLWGTVIAAMVAAPIGFVFGAWAARRAQRQLAAGSSTTSRVVRRTAGFVAAGGAVWGAVLARTGTFWPVGWVLIQVGIVAGAVSGGLVALVVLSDWAEHQSHAA
jgi:hypothetical protein